MPRLIPSLTATSTLLLTLLTTPLLAQQAALDASGGEQPAPTTEELQRPPLAERSEVEALALEQRLQTKEQQHLQAADERFLTLWLPANVGEPSGVVILLPGDDGNPDSAQSVGPRRRKLPNAGGHRSGPSGRRPAHGARAAKSPHRTGAGTDRVGHRLCHPTAGQKHRFARPWQRCLLGRPLPGRAPAGRSAQSAGGGRQRARRL